MMLRRSAGLLLMMLAAPRPAWPQAPAPLPYRDLRLPVSDRVRDLLARMTLQEKFWQLYMVSGDLDDPAHLQVYLRDVLASVARPVMELVAAQRVHLAPGEVRDVVFDLPAEQLRLLDREGRWVVEPGTFRIMVGGSSKDIRLRGELTVR